MISETRLHQIALERQAWQALAKAGLPIRNVDRGFVEYWLRRGLSPQEIVNVALNVPPPQPRKDS